MIVIGLCGSSGAGKGYVSKIFEKYGIPCIDTDRLYREKTIRKGTQCLSDLVNTFGNEILTSKGELDRTKLASIVFEGENAKEKRELLNQITHHHIKHDTLDLLSKYEAEGKTAAVIDAPVLFESGFHKMCDFTVCIIAPERIKLKRIMSRDGITKEKAQARLKSQLTNKELIEFSTYRIDNVRNGAEKQIIKILKKENII